MMKNLALTLALLLCSSLAHAQTAPIIMQGVTASHAEIKQPDPALSTNAHSGNAVQEQAQNEMTQFCNSNSATYNAARCTSAMQSYRNAKPQVK